MVSTPSTDRRVVTDSEMEVKPVYTREDVEPADELPG